MSTAATLSMTLCRFGDPSALMTGIGVMLRVSNWFLLTSPALIQVRSAPLSRTVLIVLLPCFVLTLAGSITCRRLGGASPRIVVLGAGTRLCGGTYLSLGIDDLHPGVKRVLCRVMDRDLAPSSPILLENPPWILPCHSLLPLLNSLLPLFLGFGLSLCFCSCERSVLFCHICSR